MAAAQRRSHRLPSPSTRTSGGSAAGRAAWFVLSLAAFAAATGVILVQPYAPYAPAAIGIALATLALARPAWGAGTAIALLPVADLADRTGMIHLTESDFVVLASIAGAALRFAVRPPLATNVACNATGAFVLTFGGLVIAAALALGHSLLPWPGIGWNTLSGHASPIDGLRLAKALPLSLGLLFVIRTCLRQDHHRTVAAVRAGFVVSLVFVGIAVVRERIAFVGLTDFASDYRATGPFWEMHLGGASLDGWIALTLPMLGWALAGSRRVEVSLLLAGAAALAFYAALASFSRGLYGAVAMEAMLLALWTLRHRKPGGTSARPDGRRTLLLPIAAALFGVIAGPVFATSGYRGLAAFAGAVLLAIAAGPRLSNVRAGILTGGVALGALAAGAAWFVAPLLPKGPYVAYGASAIATATALALGGRTARPALGGIALALLVTTILAVPLVATHWGGGVASSAAWTGAALAIALLPLCRAARPSLWNADGSTIVAAGVLVTGLCTVAVVGNSYYANQRFSTTTGDMSARQTHWSDSLALLQSTDEWWLGIGPGRYAERFAWRSHERFVPGGFRLIPAGDRHQLVLTGPNQPVGWGEIFRVSQRIDAEPALPLTVEATTRVADGLGSKIALHFDVCRKHLLYDNGCLVSTVVLPAGESHHSIKLAGHDSIGASHVLGWPVATRFSMGLDSVGGNVGVIDVRLLDARGHDLLRNGDFRDGAAWWFYSSDRSHLAYHAKNLWLQSLIESGLVGLAATVLLGVLTLSWLLIGPAREHPLAAPLAAGLLGFGIVALFDTVVDNPRLATIVLVSAGIALSLRAPPRNAHVP